LSLSPLEDCKLHRREFDSHDDLYGLDSHDDLYGQAYFNSKATQFLFELDPKRSQLIR
jgi:hypothetical protein